jgi:hypothetical protein
VTAAGLRRIRGGLVTAPMINLFVVPVLYLGFGMSAGRDESAEGWRLYPSPMYLEEAMPFVNATYMSLDGDISNLEDWHFDYFDDEATKAAEAQLYDSDALIMGRETYEGFAPAWMARASMSRSLLKIGDGPICCYATSSLSRWGVTASA